MLAAMDGREGMRAGDADRQAVADRLRSAVDEGRLDLHEYDERLQRAYAARTYAELDVLLADLPAVASPERTALTPDPTGPLAGGQPAPATDRGASARWLAQTWLPYLKVVAIVVTIWAVTSLLSREVLYFWPAWVAGPWGAMLALRTVHGLTGGEPRRQAMERDRPRRRRTRRRELRADGPDDRDEPHPIG
jgi:hypothetical protein